MRFFLFEVSLYRSVTTYEASCKSDTTKITTSFFSSHVFLFQYVSFQNVSGFNCLKQFTVSILKKWLKDERRGKRCEALRVCVWEREKECLQKCVGCCTWLCARRPAYVCVGWARHETACSKVQPGDICWEAGQHICKCASLLRRRAVVKM